MSIAIAIILLVITSTLFGVTLLLSYMAARLMKNIHWDQSNITNALRLLSHVVMHPNDFGKMYYLTDVQLQILKERSVYNEPNNPPKRPFPYVGLDELSQVVRTRP